MRMLLMLGIVSGLAGCHMAYNDPARFMGRLTPDELATIEPPLQDTHPDRPMMKAPHYDREIAGRSYGSYGNAGR
ncbi:hypothetical protein Geu3261_0163_008 [Komagataeibacter europaeus NBRC 3261]|uniref:Lipoprotein n=1 Tax=Komagataeibacter europaeus NBRC 3261 TaxID=1234669 RepID=A0A0D6Q3L3_KOMEU|nr:hypothetical protein Geu3261_0163_008 [Komagataeibacter europaeus NBRC 3261]